MICITLFTFVTSVMINGVTSGSSSGSFAPERFSRAFWKTWGHTAITEEGQVVELNVWQQGSAFQSKFLLQYCRLDLQIKLYNTYRSTLQTEFYLGNYKIGFKFVGVGMRKFQLHTHGGGEGNYGIQKFRLDWFDPTADYNTYSVFWNKKNILFYVNDVPIRIITYTEPPSLYKIPARINAKMTGGNDMSMRGDEDVTKSGYKEPFTVKIRNIKLDTLCIWVGNYSSCTYADPSSQTWVYQALNTPATLAIIKGVQEMRLIKG